jgi:DNA-binding response OmpR family regulator
MFLGSGHPENPIGEAVVAAHILLIDNDQSLVQSLLPVLIHRGFRVDHIAPGVDAIRQMLIDEPDLVILGIDPSEGWWFCHQLLTFLKEPSLFLLLRTDDEADRVKGLTLGADDCMARPVAIGEFAARVQGILRRRSPEGRRLRPSFFIDGNLVVDLSRRDVQLDGEPVILPAKEFLVLSCLIRHVGEVVPHEQLMTQVWGPDANDSHQILKSYIHKLRQKLEPDPRRPQRIVTRRHEGYMLQRIGE